MPAEPNSTCQTPNCGREATADNGFFCGQCDAAFEYGSSVEKNLIHPCDHERALHAAESTGYEKALQDVLSYLGYTLNISRELWNENEGYALSEYYRGSFNAESFMIRDIKSGEFKERR